jgi:hypothetical protein
MTCSQICAGQQWADLPNKDFACVYKNRGAEEGTGTVVPKKTI